MLELEFAKHPDFFIKQGKYWVTREFSSNELGRQMPELIITEEGFRIRGRNETTLIRSLSTLSGKPISDIERVMRPGQLSGAGFLGRNESLLDVLAKDNDTVLQLSLTHQELADFLMYFLEARTYATQQTGHSSIHFQYGGRTYSFFESQWRGMQENPFGGPGTNVDTTLECHNNGRVVGYSGLLPTLIYRYGFYEGRGTSYRLDPLEIAVIAGLVQDTENDPVEELVNNNEAAAIIETKSQFERFKRAARRNEGLVYAPNYIVRPSNLGEPLSLEHTGLSEDEVKAIFNHVDTSNNQPHDISETVVPPSRLPLLRWLRKFI